MCGRVDNYIYSSNPTSLGYWGFWLSLMDRALD